MADQGSMCVRRSNIKREFRHGTRGETAARCIGKIEPGIEIFGLTKGDFSLSDILRHLIAQTGPCRIDIATWTAANAEIKDAERMIHDKRILSMRWLVDRSFPTRQPAYYHQLIERFGADAIRCANSHAKFMLIENDAWSIAVRTSMNLNRNARIESYEISEGSPISRYLREIVDHHFERPLDTGREAFREYAAEEEMAAPPARLGVW